MFQLSVTPFRASQRRFSLYCGAALITLAAVSQTHAQSAPKETPLSVVRLIFGCRQQSAELANLPFDTIARIAAPDDAQHAALDALRGTAREAAERFASDCPQSVPAGPAVRLRMNFRFSRALPPGGLAHARPDDLEAFPSGLGHAASGTTYLPR